MSITPLCCRRALPVALLGLLGGPGAAWADDGAGAGSSSSGGSGFPDAWFAISDGAKESQPHWMTPLVTVTPRLEQEFRYDQAYQNRAGNVQFDNFDNGKGLEVIPVPNMEFIIGTPNYEVKTSPRERVTGWADETLLAKYRVLSANEEQGNYIVTGFLGVSLPSGAQAFTNQKALITPTLAGGYGWGTREAGLDIQSTLGVAIPVANEGAIGTTTSWNTTLQAHLGKLWPELEANFTNYHDGEHAGHSQLALTAGIIAGRFELGPRARLIIGAGYQWPVSNYRLFEDTWLGTFRIAF
jgi:hypothetical protein